MHTGIYGSITWLERLHMAVTLLQLPVVAIYRLLVSPFAKRDKHKTWRRVLTDISFRYSSSSLRVNQIQALLGKDEDVYDKWIKRHKLPHNIDVLGSNSSLMWLSKKSTEKVILYVHGGCYCLPMQDFAADYWKNTVDSINQNFSTSDQVGLVALSYPLIPDGDFPSQLKQIMVALQYLISNGTKAENIHIAGESAGGGLVLQLLSHLLHPVQDADLPSVSLSTTAASHKANSDLDVLPDWSWGELFEYSAPFLKASNSSSPYVEALTAPEGWFSDAETVVERIFMSVGEYECMRDDVLAVMKKIPSSDGFLTTFVEPKGVHNGQYLDCLAGQVGELSEKIKDWIMESIA
ncbi:hypothetical protein CVT24_001599 [Panaeolus cyanescens]|uniref:Alpha/beta hydrolase fold-3 domain-containing protein n=1 Tax=Panaeolus cyanescens TaxID=181874 RepID=A0A409YFD8_9AGAR|nr:hypothetical protein CVT24_001599 [Panaeolus cyanescens]